MELQAAIRGRRSVRKYTASPVARETIEELLGLAICAPSGMNRQAWAFGVIASAQEVAKVAEMVKAYLLIQFNEDSPLSRYRETLLAEDYSVLHHAPAAVIIYAKPGGATASIDTCLAAQNLLLAAYERGLGSCWIGMASGWLHTPQAESWFGTPSGYEPVGLLVIGEPVEWPAPTDRSAAEILFSR